MAFPRKFDHDLARERHAAGESATVIARSLGVSPSAIMRVIDPRRRERMQASSSEWHRRHRELCKGGCGRLVWVSTHRDASGYCLACSDLRRRTAQHGTETCYNGRGCRCDACRAGASAAKRARRIATRQPCSHGCGRLVDTINRRDPGKPLECHPCALARIKAERR